MSSRTQSGQRDEPETTGEPIPTLGHSPALDYDRLWNAALDEYHRTTGISLRGDPAFSCLSNPCMSVDSILDSILRVSDDLRYGRRARLGPVARVLRSTLKPVVAGFVNVFDALAGDVIPGGRYMFAALAVLLHAARKQSAINIALTKLLDRLAVYAERLQARLEVPVAGRSWDTMVRALVEVMKVLALAAKTLRRGPIARRLRSWTAHKDSDVRSAIQRLEAIMADEEKSAITDVVVGIHHLSSEIHSIHAAMSTLHAGHEKLRQDHSRTDASTHNVPNRAPEDEGQRNADETMLAMLQTLTERSVRLDRMEMIIRSQSPQSMTLYGGSGDEDATSPASPTRPEDRVVQYYRRLEGTDTLIDHGRTIAAQDLNGNPASGEVHANPSPLHVAEGVTSIAQHYDLHRMLDDRLSDAQQHAERGISLANRFDVEGDIGDLHDAIEAYRQAIAIELVSAERLNLATWLENLGRLLQLRFHNTNVVRDLKDAIVVTERAVALTNEDDVFKSERLGNFGAMALSYYRHTGDFDRLHKAVSALRLAVSLARSNGRPVNSTWLNVLGISLRTRFECSNDPEDLNGAIDAHYRAVDFTLDDHADKAGRLSNLGICLCLRYCQSGCPDDIESSLRMLRSANNLTPSEDTAKPQRLYSLGIAMQSRFEKSGELDDLTDAISMLSSATDLVSHSHPDRPYYAGAYSTALHTLFMHTHRLRDLRKAIRVERQAIQLTPEGPHDLRSAIAPHRHAIELTPSGVVDQTQELNAANVCLRHDEHLRWSTRHIFHFGYDRPKPDYGALLSNLGRSLYILYVCLHNFEDLNSAIALCRRAVELTRDDDHYRLERLSDLGLYLYHRYEHLKDPNDYICSMIATQRAISLGLEDQLGSLASDCIESLGHSFFNRFECLDMFFDFARNAELARQAIDHMPNTDPGKRARLMYLLSTSIYRRFERSQALDDLRYAVSMGRRATELAPDGYADVSAFREGLSISLQSLFIRERARETFDAARACLIAVVHEVLGEPSRCLRAAIRYVQLLKHAPEFSSTHLLLKAHSDIIHALPKIAWLGYNVKRRFEQISRLGAIVNTAVGVAIGFGDRQQALEWLEAGRTLVWVQILSTRTPLDDIADHHPDLVRTLLDIRAELQRSDFTAMERHREVVAEYERLMNRIRVCSGCHNLLRPRTLASLISSTAFSLLSGTVVFINIAESSCDALVLSQAGSVRRVPLPRLTQSRAQNMLTLWTKRIQSSGLRRRGISMRNNMRGSSSIFAQVLERLWTWIVHPILQALHMVELQSATEHLPHIVWCPTGPLTQLPLHAAGVYGAEPAGPRVTDFVVSSYIPSLSAVLRCCSGIVKEYPAPNVLVVTQPETPEQLPLPGTYDECTRLDTVLHNHTQITRLDHMQATVESTLAVVRSHPWIHLACHAAQNLDDPTQSAFMLYDGPLTLEKLMATVADKAELAFLSACQTALGDEKIPEESAHLAAGMLAAGFKGVVATMWSIRDDDAPIVVEAYYQTLLQLRLSHSVRRGETGAAYALHEATKRLRERVGEGSFERWVPFVHFGV